MNPRLAAWLFGALGAFIGATVAWIVFGVLTPGDSFANGSALVLPVTLVASSLTAWLTSRARSRAARIAVGVAAAACIAFWLFAREGWWAHGP